MTSSERHRKPVVILGIDSQRFKIPPTKKKTFGIAATAMIPIKVLRMMLAGPCDGHFLVSPGPFNKLIPANTEWVVLVRNISSKPRRFMAAAFAHDMTPRGKRRSLHDMTSRGKVPRSTPQRRTANDD